MKDKQRGAEENLTRMLQFKRIWEKIKKVKSIFFLNTNDLLMSGDSYFWKKEKAQRSFIQIIISNLYSFRFL